MGGNATEVRPDDRAPFTFGNLRDSDYGGRAAARLACHHRSCRTTDTNLATARARAKQLRAEIALGADPRGEEKVRKEVPTLTDFFQNQFLPYIKPRLRSWKRSEQLFRLQL